jgi:hypothetical protein
MNSLLAILVPFLLVSIVLSNPVERQKRQDAAEVNVCGRYEQPIQNPRGETRCIPKPGSCAGMTFLKKCIELIKMNFYVKK